MLGTHAPRSRKRAPVPIKRAPARMPRVAGKSATPRAAETALATGRRPLTLLVVMAICAAGLFSRLVFWQVMDHTHLLRMAEAQQASIFNVPALRGGIYDAGGAPLAAESTEDDVSAAPNEIKNPARAARLLAPVLGVNQLDLQRNLTGGAVYVPLATRVPDSVGNRIQRLGLPGIALSPEPVRVYPEDSTASQIVGYVDQDGVGQYGLERMYNSVLSGTAGIRSVLKDTSGATIKVSSAAPVPAQNGANIHLSLDPFIQNLAETQLSAAVKKHRADGGSIIIMDPHTGYVLGLANNPTFNPNHYSTYANAGQTGVYMNPAIEGTYEPGSTFKIITMAAGLDAHVVTPSTSFFDSGTWMVDGVPLHNWNLLGNGEENMTQVLQHSANVGASFVASRLHAPAFYRYVRAFGMGRPTGIDLPNEVGGDVLFPNQKGWSDVTLYTNSFGQGISTTPMQMIRAVAAVANGGIMMKPQVVRTIAYRGHIIRTHPIVARRVISAQTARTLTHMLVESAIGGEASQALIKGYDIAAKTGTANVSDGHGGYIPNDTVASTVAYAPASHPRYIVLVKLDHPRDTIWGSMAAAPVIRNVFLALFSHGHIAPSPHALNR